ncbi:MAG: signal recognition particle-docking protein FtsY, partial [Mycoplasmataceae bacterium]|nr:signal recognition particle-docking protein FtsY [Mycoplasmataceae bacterium]
VHANKIGVDIITPDKVGEDPAAVTYKGIKKGYEEDYSLIICDTSGRLQNKVNLMNELSKIVKQIKKFDETAPHEILLVLDATVGQSGLAQAKAFNEAAKVSGIVLVKMDSSSKGGIVLAIKDQFNIPVKLIGYGETLQDIAEFNLEEYIKNLIKNIKIDNTSNTQNK